MESKEGVGPALSLDNKVSASFTINQEDRIFIDRLRGLSIMRVVLVHLGLSWFYPPYSQFVLVFLPLLFFVSGAVSFPVFLRAKGSLHYAVKRLSSVVIPYYVIAAFIVIALFISFPSQYPFDGKRAIRWLVVSPTSEMAPFSLGQLWFIRSLLVISIISIPVYILAKKNLNYLLAPIAISVMVAYYQTYSDIHHYFYIDFFNLYQPIVNAGFFFLGSYYYTKKRSIGLKAILTLMVFSASVSAFAFFDAGLTKNMADHSFAPNLYYVGLSFSVIFFVILAKPIIQKFISYFRIVDYFVLSYSKHAYSIFIVHSFLIYFSEVMFGWEDLMARPVIAVAKVTFVIFGSLLLSIPITAITQKVSKELVNSAYGK